VGSVPTFIKRGYLAGDFRLGVFFRSRMSKYPLCSLLEDMCQTTAEPFAEAPYGRMHRVPWILSRSLRDKDGFFLILKVNLYFHPAYKNSFVTMYCIPAIRIPYHLAIRTHAKMIINLKVVVSFQMFL